MIMKTWVRKEYIWWRELVLDHPIWSAAGMVVVLGGGIGWGAPAGIYLNHMLYRSSVPTSAATPAWTSTPEPVVTRSSSPREPSQPTHRLSPTVHHHQHRIVPSRSSKPSPTPIPSETSSSATPTPEPSTSLCLACNQAPASSGPEHP